MDRMTFPGSLLLLFLFTFCFVVFHWGSLVVELESIVSYFSYRYCVGTIFSNSIISISHRTGPGLFPISLMRLPSIVEKWIHHHWTFNKIKRKEERRGRASVHSHHEIYTFDVLRDLGTIWMKKNAYSLLKYHH